MAPTTPVEPNAEQRILVAARELFASKGYAQTSTRDIAKKAEVNVALINYYFRSKENLFRTVIMEHVLAFLSGIKEIINNPETALEYKLEQIVENYISLMIQRPDLPLFILNSIHSNLDELISSTPFFTTIGSSVLFNQLQAAMEKGQVVRMHPIQLFMNLFGMILFPFLSRPMYKPLFGLSDKEFQLLMIERKQLIPRWISAVLQP